MTVFVATPHYAKDVAKELARIDGEVFDQLTGETRDRYWRYAAWVTDDYVTGDDFHESCMPADVHYDGVAEAYEDGIEKGVAIACEAIATLGRETTGPARDALREAYRAAQDTQSGEAAQARTENYLWERKASEGR